MERAKEQYYIKTNSNGRRILVINEPFNPDYHDELTYESYDAIFANYGHSYVDDITIVWSLLPMFSAKSWLKPLFLVPRFTQRFRRLVQVADGFANSPEDQNMAKRIEEIETLIEQSGVSRVKDHAPTHEAMFINLCRYCLSRGIDTYTNTEVRGFAKGFTGLLTQLFGENLFIDKRLAFHQNLLDHDYVQQTRFVDRIHLCQSCLDSHLMFIEACPKCGSSLIHDEPVIHHFRCANISPESTYAFDGQLKCPKCGRFLRHIGVDYDIPESMYTCADCGHSFLTPRMRVQCASCSRVTSPDDLSTKDIYEFRFTDAGRRALISDEIRYNVNTNIFSGYSDREDFINTFKIMVYANIKKENISVLMIKVTLPVDNSALQDNRATLVQTLVYKLNAFKINISQGKLYIMQSTDVGEAETRAEEVRKTVDEVLQSVFDTDTRRIEFRSYIYQKTEHTDEFLRRVESDDYAARNSTMS